METIPSAAPGSVDAGGLMITLEQKHIDYADALAKRRYDAARKRGRVPTNDGPIGELGLYNDINGARGECAGYLYFKPVRWNTFADEVNGLPDLDKFIDIRTITDPTHRLIVQKRNRPDWAYVLMDGSQHPFYEPLMWAWGRDCQQEQFWCDPRGGRPAYFVDQAAPFFHRMGELMVILRQRQAL